MPQELFTADEVAERLGLHVRTVRNYVRDGRLKAVRIGKQYRIARADLEAFTGQQAEPSPRESAPRRRRVGVTNIIEIDAIGREDLDRLTTLLTTSVAHQRDGDQRLHLKTIYDEERAQLKIIVLGSLSTSASILELIGAALGEAST